MFTLIKQDPVLFQALVQATIALLSGFHVIPLSEEKKGLLMAFTAALPFFARAAVTPLSNPKDKNGKSLS